MGQSANVANPRQLRGGMNFRNAREVNLLFIIMCMRIGLNAGMARDRGQVPGLIGEIDVTLEV